MRPSLSSRTDIVRYPRAELHRQKTGGFNRSSNGHERDPVYLFVAKFAQPNQLWYDFLGQAGKLPRGVVLRGFHLRREVLLRCLNVKFAAVDLSSVTM